MKKTSALPVLAAALTLWTQSSALAGTVNYTNGANDAILDNGSDWDTSNIPITTDEAVIGTVPLTNSATVLTIVTPQTFGDLVLNLSTLTTLELTGGATNENITLSGNGGSAAATAAGGANGDLLVLGSNVTTGTVTVGGGKSTGSLGLILGTSGNFDVVKSGATLDVSGIVSGAFDLTKTGAGTLELDATNSFNNLYILDGTVDNGTTGNSTNFGTGTIYLGATSGSNSATLNDGQINVSNNIVVQAGTTGTLTITSAYENPVFSGNVALNNNLTLSMTRSGARALTFSGVITGSSTITVFSDNNSSLPGVEISGANASSFTGNVFISQGILGFDMNSLGQNSTGGTISFASSDGGGIPMGLQWSGVNTQDLSGRLQALTGTAVVTLDVGTNNVTFATANGLAGGSTTGYTKLATSKGMLILAAANSLSGTYTATPDGGLGGVTLLTNANALQDATVSLSGTGSTGGITFDSSVAGHAFTFGNLTSTGNLVLQDNGGNAVALSVGNNNNATSTYSGILSGSGSLIKVGTGILLLNGASTYTGATTVNGGILRAGIVSIANGSGAFGNNSAVTVGSSGTVDIDGLNTQIGSLTGSGGVTNSTTTTATLSVGGDNTSPADFIGVISGATHLILAKIGTGTLTLGGANTYSGGTVIDAGTLTLDFTAAGAPASNILLSSGALTLGGGTLNVNSTTSGTSAQTLASLTLSSGASTIAMTNNGATSDALTFTTGAIARATGGGTVDFISPANTSITLTGNNSNALIGTWAFFGSGASETYAATNASGVVQAATLTSVMGINSFVSATTAYAYTSPGSPDTLTASRTANTAVFSTTGTQVIDLGSSGANTLTMNGFINTGGTLTIQRSGSSTGTLTIGSNQELVIGGSSNVTITAPIVDNSGGASILTDSNTGVLTLSGANTFTGGVVLNSGTLEINGVGVAGTSGPLGNGGTFVINGGTIDNTSGSVETELNVNPITIGGSFAYSTVAGTANNSLTFSGAVSMTTDNTITLNGLGALTLGGTLNATTTNSARVLTVNDGAGTGLTTLLTLGGYTLTSSATARTDVIDGSGNVAITGVIANGTGTGSLAYSGTGSLTLSGASTYTGGTILNSGTLNINGVGVAGTSGPLGNGGAFTINGGTINNTSGSAEVVANANPIIVTGDFAFGTSAGTTANNLTLSGVVTMTGTHNITLNGLGTLDLSGAWAFVANSNNILTVNNGSGTGSSSLLTLGSVNMNSGTNGISDLTLDGNGNMDVTGVIAKGSGMDSVFYSGTGTLTLSGQNTFAGGLTITSGTVVALGSITPSQIFGNGDGLSIGGATLDLQSTTTTGLTFVNGTGNIATTITGNTQINSDRSTSGAVGDTYTFGTLSIGGETLTIDGGMNVTSGTAGVTFGAVTSTGSSTFTVNNPSGGTTLLTLASITPTAGSTITFNGTGNASITGVVGATSTAVTKSGSGTLTLGGADTFTGGLNVQQGTVVLANTTAAGAGTVTIGSTGTSGILDLNGASRTIIGLATAGTAANQTIGNGGSTAATLNYTGATTSTFGGVIRDALGSGSSTTAVTVNNASANLTLSGANTYSGATTITTGTLILAGSNSSAGTTTLTAGTLDLDSTSNGGLASGTLSLTSGTLQALTSGISISNAVTLTAVTVSGAQGFTINGAFSEAGSNTLTNDLSSGTLMLAGNVNIDQSASTSRTLTIASTGNTTISGAIQDYSGGTGSAHGAVTIASSGVTTFSGVNTYGGPTTVNLGTLALEGGSLAGTAITVGTGATPTASAGNATLQVDGNYTIGSASAGTLTIKGGNTGSTPLGQGMLSLEDGTINTLTLSDTGTSLVIGSNTNGNNSILSMDVGLGGADEIALAAGAKISIGTSTTANVVNLNGLGSLNGVTQTLISAPGGTAAGSFSNFALGTTTGNFDGYTVALAFTTTALTLTESANAAAANAYWNGAAAAVSGQGGTTAWNSFVNGNTDTSNFGTSAGGSGNANGLVGASTNVFFDNGTTSPTTTTLGQNLTINSLTFSAANSVIIGGANLLTIEAAAINGNAASSGVTVATGAANDTISSNVALGASQTWTVTDSSNTLTASGAISGSGDTLTKAGAGSLVLSGNNSYTGGTIISAGQFFANNVTSSTGTGAVSVSSGAILSGIGTIAPTGGNGITVANGGILAPGSGQTAPYAGTPGMQAVGSLTLANAAPLTLSSSAKLTFTLGADGTSSALSVLGSTVTFHDNVVTINDLVGADLTLNQEYVLFVGDKTTTYDNLMTTGILTSNGYLITGGLSLLTTTPGTNFFADYFGGSQLYLTANGDIDIEVIPEPGTWGLMMGGFALLIVLQRRRNKLGWFEGPQRASFVFEAEIKTESIRP